MAAFSLGESPLPRNFSPRNGASRDWEEFASALLEDGFVLTALELHTELLEYGKEIPTLRDYFSNPGNFEHTMPSSSITMGSDMVRTSSMSTFDSMELGRYSDDSNRDTDDKVAVLEFELRRAYETIKSLRGSLTEATEIGPSKDREIGAKVKVKSDDPIKPHEKRALNFLVHEYLMQQENKLTAITFTEENGDQDFDDWDDVGLNIPKPPDLLYLFRNYSTCTLTDREKIDRIQQLEDQLVTVTGENLALKRENEALQLRLKRTSISGPGSPDSFQKTHRRGGSLTERPKQKEVTEVKRQRHERNRSSPEVELVTVMMNAVPGKQQVKSEESERRRSEGEERRDSEGGDGSPKREPSSEKRGLSKSMISSTSVTSDITLSGDDADTVIDDDKGTPNVEGDSRDRSTTLKRETSESSTTLENEKQEGGERSESESLEHKYQMSVVFRQELLSIIRLKTDSRIGLEVAKLSDPDVDMVELFSRCLPHIVPNVILAKREELIPILLCVISKHPNSKTRDQLLHMMFNLIKRPDKRQRQVIMSGCVAFAKITGSTRVESELLPQMWEQITHKYYERRLLVAESCGVLAPYIPPELRGSLVVSMLQQMLTEDKAESVRQAVTRSLAIILAFTDDEDKFKQCWELVLKSLRDPSQLVVSATYSSLLPALAAWACELGTFESGILSYFLHQLLTCIKQVSRSDGESGAVEQSQHHIITLTNLVPWHFTSILLSGPYVANLSVEGEQTREVYLPQPSSPLLDVHVIVGDDAKLSALVESFEREVGGEAFTPWKNLEWFCKEYLNKILKASVALGFSQSELVHSIAVLLSAYCNYFGYTFTHKVIRPFFEEALTVPKQNLGTALAEGQTHLTTPVLPVYIAGVLACFSKDTKLLVSYLRSVVVDLALNFAPLDSLRASFSELKRERRHHSLLLGVLQDLVTHSSFQVRRYIASLFGLLIRNVDEKLVMRVVLPHLIKLARDSEIAVRIDTIGSFGTIMEAVTRKEILVRVHEQFEAFMGQEQYRADHQVTMAVLRTLAKIGPHADPVFRDEFIIPRLAEVAMENYRSDNVTRKSDIALALLDAYRNISECFISSELLTTYMLPGLKRLQQDIGELEAGKVPVVQQLMRSCQLKVEEHQRQTGTPDGAGEGKSGTLFSRLMTPFDRDSSISPSKLFKKKS